MTSIQPQPCIADLLHDFRQPLSIIGLSASYLELVIGPQHAKAREQVRMIQDQVENLSRLLLESAAEVSRLQALSSPSAPFKNAKSAAQG